MRSLNLTLAVVVLVIIVTVGLLVVVYERGSHSADAHLSLSDLVFREDTEDNDYQATTTPLRFAIAAVFSPRSILESHEPLASYLGKQLGHPVEIVVGQSYAEINSLVQSGGASLALVCSGAFVLGQRDFGMEPLVIPRVDGKTTYHSYLIVPSTSFAHDWPALRGKSFAFTDPLSNSGRLVPVYVLSQMGETPDSFFQDYIFTYSHDRSVQAVAGGLVDGAAVDSLVYDFMIEDDPTIGAKTKVVWRSPPYGINPIVVHPDINPELRSRFESIFLDMSSDADGQRILQELGIDSFIAPQGPEAYATIEDMINETVSR